MISTAPERYFRPPYYGVRGWLGVWLDLPVDWEEIALLLDYAFCCVAPRRLIARMEEERFEAGAP